MKKHRNLKKRFAALCLAAVLFLGLALPDASYAQETLETGILEEGTSETQEQTDAEQSAESMSEMQTTGGLTESETGTDDSQLPAASGTLEESTDEIQAQTDSKGQTEETGKAAETDETKESDKAEETDQAPIYLNTQPLSENYDIEKPVIENVQLVQNGQTLKEGESVELRVKAYDAKSGIRSVTAEFYGENGDLAHTMSLSYDDASGEYVGIWTLENMASAQIQLRELQVTDNSNNYIQAEVRDEKWNYKYWFNAISEAAIKITDFQLAANGQTLKEDQIGSDLGFSLTLDQPINPYENVYIHFKSWEGYYYIFYMSADKTGMKLNYRNSTSMEPYGDAVKTYTLERIFLKRTGGDVELDISEFDTYSFSVEFTNEDSTEDTDPKDEVKITGIEFSHNREKVNVGDIVQLKIYVESQEKLSQTGFAYFNAASDITDDTRYIDLLYNEEKGMYTGNFEITEELYPCEWYLDRLELWTNNKHSFFFILENYPYYINVLNENTFTEDTKSVSVSFVTRDALGVYNYSEAITVENAGRRPTLGDLGIALPEMSSAIAGVNQTGWEDDAGSPVNIDTKLYNDGMIYIYATYDKLIVPVVYSYAMNNGVWRNSSCLYILEPGSTYSMLIEKAGGFQPADAMAGHPIVQWKGDTFDGYNSDDEVIDPRINEFSMLAQYDDVLVLLKKGYFNANGGYTQGDFYLDGAYQGSLAFFVPKGTTYKELKDMLNAQELPKMYEGLRFTGWTYLGLTEDMDNQEVTETSVDMKAEYENFIIRYVIWNETGETNRVFCQTAEAGETVTIPDTFDGVDGKVSWFDPIEGTTFVVDSEYREAGGKCYTFAGSGKLSDTSVQPEEPEEPGDPETPETGLPSEMVDTVIENIQNTDDGQTVTVPMNGATVISKDILQAAKGRDVTIVLDMGGYTWTINGMNILASDLKDINLEVRFDTNAVPSSIVKELAGDQSVRQISLTYNGDFGFKATLTMNAGKEYAGQYGNLYYYDSDGKLVFMNVGAIGADGNVSLDFSHASDYVLVISEQVMNPGNGSGGQETSGGSGQNANSQSQENPKTGDTAPLAMMIAIMALGAGIGIIAVKKRFFTKES